MRSNATAIFISLDDVICADSDQSTIANFKFTMKLNQTFMLSTLLRTKTSATEQKHHWIVRLQFRELPSFRGVIRKLIIRKHRSWHNVSSHMCRFLRVVSGSIVRSDHSLLHQRASI